MTSESNISTIIGWLSGLLILSIGILNVILIHPVPGLAYVLLSQPYFPPVNELIRRKFGIVIPVLLKVGIGIILFFFTLGVSDLAERFGL